MKRSGLGRRELLTATAAASAGAFWGGLRGARAAGEKPEAAAPQTAPATGPSASTRALAGRLSGVIAPVVTPFAEDLSVDLKRLARHGRWLLKQGCRALAVFGTTSEANSLSVEEREQLLHGLLDSGLAPSSLLPGTGCCALPDTVRLTRLAVKSGCAGVLMLPPFYYKGVSDEGLFRSYADVIERVGESGLRVYLYHIPPVSQVGLSLALIERLLKAYPKTIAGMKDSSGDWNNTKAAVDAFAKSGFDVFVGTEKFLLANLRAGGVGTITATANVNPAAIDRVYRERLAPGADELQGGINVVRGLFERQPAIPALKQVIAHYSGDPGFRTVRPPLTELTPKQEAGLLAGLAQAGFSMPGLREA